jgi:hypothetical protein
MRTISDWSGYSSSRQAGASQGDEQGGLYIYYNFTLSLEHYSRFVVYD